jgi:hypothetical protein
MKYSIYDSKILAPSKCGTRYLDTVFDITDYANPKKTTVLPKGTKLNDLKPPPKLKEQFFAREWSEWEVNNWRETVRWVVIRPPEEHTISAINTELLLLWNSGNTVLSEEKKLVDNLLLNKQGHYDSTLFKQLYFFWSSAANAKNNIKFIHLKDLTHFAKEYLDYKKDLSNVVELHDFSNFPIFMSKVDMMDYFKKAHFNEWRTIESNMKLEMFFWELIQKNCEFYEPRII